MGNEATTPGRRGDRRRRGALAVGVCLALIALAQVGARPAAALPAGAAPEPGLDFNVLLGSADTMFTISLSNTSNTCPGDSPDYRWNTFVVDSSVDAATLTYGADGPIGSGTEFVKPIFDASGGPVANRPIVGGVVPSAAVAYTFNPYRSLPGGIPTAVYKVGIACTLNGETRRFWQRSITFNPAPTLFTWNLGGVPATTPPATTPPATTVPPPPTVAPGTTVVTPPTTVAAPPPTTAVASGGPPVSARPTSGRRLPVAGSETLPVVGWAVLLVLLGRGLVRIGRPARPRRRQTPAVSGTVLPAPVFASLPLVFVGGSWIVPEFGDGPMQQRERRATVGENHVVGGMQEQRQPRA